MWFFRKKFVVAIVCTANVTRSAFFSGLLHQKIKALPGRRKRRITVISAGTQALDGNAADLVVKLLARHHGFGLTYHRSRKFDERMALAADLVLTMEARHKTELLEQFPMLAGKVFTVLEYGRDDEPGEMQDIADPTGQTPEKYEQFISVAADEAERVLEEFMRNDIC